MGREPPLILGSRVTSRSPDDQLRDAGVRVSRAVSPADRRVLELQKARREGVVTQADFERLMRETYMSSINESLRADLVDAMTFGSTRVIVIPDSEKGDGFMRGAVPLPSQKRALDDQKRLRDLEAAERERQRMERMMLLDRQDAFEAVGTFGISDNDIVVKANSSARPAKAKPAPKKEPPKVSPVSGKRRYDFSE